MKYHQSGALVVTFATLQRLINCRIIISRY